MQPERGPARGVDPDGLALAMSLDQLGAGQGGGDLTRSMRATNPGVGVVDLGDPAAEPSSSISRRARSTSGSSGKAGCARS
jgi:hypothetical protein